MGAYAESLARMLEIWNTTDADRKAALAEMALELNVHFVDPKSNVIGRAAFLEMVEGIQKQLPGAVYSRASAIDAHNNHCRYHWAIHQAGDFLLTGFDVTEVTDAGKIVKVTGFFGELTPNAA